MKEEYLKLYNKALEAMENAYVPYSKFKVGASVLLEDDNIITGFNIENSSYGLTNCAERNCLFRTYMEGYKKENIKMLFVVADTKLPVSPCGACRQVMQELMDVNTLVVLSNLKGDIKEMTVSDLLPFMFDSEDLNV